MRYLILLLGFIIIFSCKSKKSVDPGTVDCAGVIGGKALLDNCGECDTDSTNDCMDCSNDLNYNISTAFGIYAFVNVIINSEPIALNDTVWAFNGDICVGAQVWDTNNCNSEVCTINVNGYNGDSYTQDYCKSGQVPTFIIQDVSANTYYNASVSGTIFHDQGCFGVAPECMDWKDKRFVFVDSLIAITPVPCQ